MSDAIFTLDFAREGTLVGQLTDNIRRAIATRTLKPGQTLPSIVKMAELCKTSVRITPRGADPRPRIVTDDCRDFTEVPGPSAGR